MSITYEEIVFGNLGNALRLSDGKTQITVTTDVGPRIISAGIVDSQNFCFVDIVNCGHMEGEAYEAVFGKGAQWHTFGGHRIWTSPEHNPKSYYPDCTPVNVEYVDNGAVFTAEPERVNLVQKSLRITYNADGSISVITAVKNTADVAQCYAAWGLTVLDGGGVEIVPFADEDTGLLANRVMGIWPYNDMSDARVFLGEKFITIKQEPVDRPFKIGTNNTKCYSAYLKNGEIFKKNTEYIVGAEYPDYGCSFETYTNRWFIEMESLSPLADVQPGETAQINEIWRFYKAQGELDARSNASIEAFVSANGIDK